ncbi:MAG: SBBP repeat-containing protein [Chitinophagales bacterium]|nr:SBBP repeat-containing protein [Chitinophagales bacterium]
MKHQFNHLLINEVTSLTGKWCKYYLIVLLIIAATLPGLAQYNVVDWGAYFSDDATGWNFADDELIDDIKVDNGNPENIYVVGRTRSASGSAAPCQGNLLSYGKGDVMLAKYNRCGELLWSRYLGNKKKTDYAYSIALDYDDFGNTFIYVAGEMKTSGTGPEAIVCDDGNIPFRSLPAGTWDGFIAKYNQKGEYQRWTYFGGSDAAGEKVDQILGIAVNNHEVFVVGYTESPDLHKNALFADDTSFEGAGDGFLAGFSADLHSLEYFTYIGGSGKDRCHGITIYQPPGVAMPDIFVDGTTPSSNGIAAGTGFDITLGGDLDGFVGKWQDIDNDGKFTKTWATYIGGGGIERARDMDVDNNGNILLVGQTNSTSLSWAKGYDSIRNGQFDAFVIKLPNAGGDPVWGTYLGGYADEETVGLAWRKGANENHVIVGGITYSSQKETCLPVPNPDNFTVFPLKDPLLKYINGKPGAGYCPGTVGDAFIAELTDKAVGQSLVFSTFIGGSGNEVNGENQLSYNPSFALSKYGELYIAFNSRSIDIAPLLGPSIHKLYGSYHGGIDGVVARLIDSNAFHYHCTSFREIDYPAGSQTGNTNDVVKVYPNPSQNIFNVEYIAESGSEARLAVVNQVGKIVITKSIMLQPGFNSIAIDLTGLMNGIYILQVCLPEKTLQVKLLKQ